MAQDREQAMKSAAEKSRLAKLASEDIGKYGRSIGILPRYLAGSTWKKRSKK